MPAIGHRTWTIPDAYLPSTGRGEQWESHECICMLNAGDHDAEVHLTCYFADRDPITGIEVRVPARRDIHLRLDHPGELGGISLPFDTPYGIVVASDQPIVVQYSRLDVTQPNFALMTTTPLGSD